MEHSLQSVQAESHANSPAQRVNTGKGRAQPERLSSLRAYSPRQRSWAHSPALLLNSTEAWTGQGAQPVTCALMRQSLKPHRTRELWTETAPTPDAHSPAPPTHGTGREAPPRWEPGQPLHSQRPPGLQSPAVALPNFRVQPVTPREGRPPRPHRSRSNGGAQPIALPSMESSQQHHPDTE